MRRKRNRILKRLVLGFAVAALVAPSAAMARVDAGSGMLPNGSTVGQLKASDSIENARLNPRGVSSTEVVIKAGDYGVMPRVIDIARQRGDAIEVARTHPRNVVTADIENVRLQPRTTSSPELVSTGFDWGDAGVGAAIVFGLALLGGLAFYATRNQGKAQTA
jgi:hypothetical protein